MKTFFSENLDVYEILLKKLGTTRGATGDNKIRNT
jgi:hypothetical protein